MVGYVLCFALGTFWLQQQPVLPDLAWAALLLFALPVSLLPARWPRLRRGLLLALAALAGFFYAAWQAGSRLADSLPEEWQGVDIVLSGRVTELPRVHERGQRFTFEVDAVHTPGAHVPRHILLATYQDGKTSAPWVAAGERWQFTVRLKQPHGNSNPHGFDYEAWLLERKLRATGYVHNKGDNRLLDAEPGNWHQSIERLRGRVRENFRQTLGDVPLAGVLVALAIGDQASISAEQWQVFTRTGVNHLMSISGLHVTLFSSLVFALVYALWKRNTRLALWLPARKAAALAGFAAALGYALLSGYGIPAQRTLYMLGTVALLLLGSRQMSPAQILASALLMVLLFDPWASLAPGFWLSFGAVALIFYISANRIPAPGGQTLPRWLHHPWRWLREYGRVQWAMSLGLIPLLLALFQQMSLVAPLANFFAIPLVSLLVVPLTLLGALPLLDFLLYPALWLMQLCYAGLTVLEQWPLWTQHAPPPWTVPLGLLGVMWLLLPRGFPARWLGGILLLPMFLVAPEAPAPGTARITVFDAGQGLAVAAQTAQHALLFDAGPDFSGEADSGKRILLPALRGMGITELDKLILSHDDSDHTGGAASLLEALPVHETLSSLPPEHTLLAGLRHQPCRDGQNWEWDGVRFEILHPGDEASTGKKVRDNDLGCVLRIASGTHSMLVTADIEKASERRLLKLHAEALATDVLVAPHHGSKSSSSAAFVAAAHPKTVIFTVGYRNRFGHPHPEVEQRYREAGSTILRSDRDGAIHITMNTDGIRLECQRWIQRRYWMDTLGTSACTAQAGG